jgi:hypothetical protein
MPGRQFKYEVKLADVEVTWDPADDERKNAKGLTFQATRDAIARYSKIIKAWRIHVWNSALPVAVQKRLRLASTLAPNILNIVQAT